MKILNINELSEQGWSFYKCFFSVLVHKSGLVLSPISLSVLQRCLKMRLKKLILHKNAISKNKIIVIIIIEQLLLYILCIYLSVDNCVPAAGVVLVWRWPVTFLSSSATNCMLWVTFSLHILQALLLGWKDLTLHIFQALPFYRTLRKGLLLLGWEVHAGSVTPTERLWPVSKFRGALVWLLPNKLMK